MGMAAEEEVRLGGPVVGGAAGEVAGTDNVSFVVRVGGVG